MKKDFNFFKVFNDNSTSKKFINSINLQKNILWFFLIVLIIIMWLATINIKMGNKKIEESLETNKNILYTLENSEELKLSVELQEYSEDLMSVENIVNDLGDGEFQIDYRNLLSISNSLPNGVFIEKIALNEGGDASTLISGYSISTDQIADFQNNIRQSEYFEDVFIDNIVLEEGKGFKFNMYFTITEPKEEEEVEEVEVEGDATTDTQTEEETQEVIETENEEAGN